MKSCTTLTTLHTWINSGCIKLWGQVAKEEVRLREVSFGCRFPEKCLGLMATGRNAVFELWSCMKCWCDQQEMISLIRHQVIQSTSRNSSLATATNPSQPLQVELISFQRPWLTYHDKLRQRSSVARPQWIADVFSLIFSHLLLLMASSLSVIERLDGQTLDHISGAGVQRFLEFRFPSLALKPDHVATRLKSLVRSLSSCRDD